MEDAQEEGLARWREEHVQCAEDQKVWTRSRSGKLQLKFYLQAGVGFPYSFHLTSWNAASP